MKKKDATGLAVIILAMIQAGALYLDSTLGVYVLMIPIMILSNMHFEEHFKEKWGVKEVTKQGELK